MFKARRSDDNENAFNRQLKATTNNLSLYNLFSSFVTLYRFILIPCVHLYSWLHCGNTYVYVALKFLCKVDAIFLQYLEQGINVI